MKGFAILGRANEKTVKERYPFVSKIAGLNKLINPFYDNEYVFNDTVCARLNVTDGLIGDRIKGSYKRSLRKYGYVVSSEFDINYNKFFHHSCLIRALDLFSISQGCDLRLNEVVIADGATAEGLNAFRLLLPVARRIVLVTDRKNNLKEEADYAMLKYGTSVAVIEDAVKAAERADIVVIASENPDHKYLMEIERPMLYFRYPYVPKSKLWFNNIEVSFGNNEGLDLIYAQGYVDVNKKNGMWIEAEKDGFRISALNRMDTRISLDRVYRSKNTVLRNNLI